MVKRKRHAKKSKLKSSDLLISKKRGRVVVTKAEEELKKTTKELEAELQQLKTLKTELRKAKARKKRQPAPVEERKALDHMPVDAGSRVDRKTRLARREAKKAHREEVLARRERLRLRKEKKLAEEVGFANALGADFFGGQNDDGEKQS
eukprot:TRINITY_DN5242_c0_g1_i1.p1 TRINITY_DN5242_c0_g1~~TRINITY_DN5242_c0_g1_i1.p1  ORF type:complete len:149 (+),score=56.78 TRINITY_DN5242_c0_g1_i1:78-524(+)